MQVTETKKRVLGHEHPDTLSSMANLASAYRNQGQWKKAEELFLQVVEISLRCSATDISTCASSMYKGSTRRLPVHEEDALFTWDLQNDSRASP